MEQSIRNAAKAEANRTGRDANRLIREVTFDRFLCRIFTVEPSAFLLKGGTGMLARISDSRATRDIDLAAEVVMAAQVVPDLVEAASRNLGDFFRFVYLDDHPLLQGDNQPYATGRRVRFQAYIGTALRDTISVDLVISAHPTSEPTVVEPANRLPLPRLHTTSYRLIPIEDQIADKVCACRGTYGADGAGSTRVKDLVDLVAIALTQTVRGTQLSTALRSEQARRRLAPASTFTAPIASGSVYRKLATSSVVTAPFSALVDAVPLVAHLVDPALTGAVDGRTWDPSSRSWQPPLT